MGKPKIYTIPALRTLLSSGAGCGPQLFIEEMVPRGGELGSRMDGENAPTTEKGQAKIPPNYFTTGRSFHKSQHSYAGSA